MNVKEVRQSQAQIPVLKQSHKRSAASSFEQQLKDTTLPTNTINGTETPIRAQEQPAALTKSEKKYFEQLFPHAAEEVRTYNPYQRDGATTAVTLGTVVDRKG